MARAAVASVAASAVEPDEAAGPPAVAQMRADVSPEWSWVSSAARIPQIWNLTVDAPALIENARISVTVHDADVLFGSCVALEGRLEAGATKIESAHVPLSASVMAGVDERRGAQCLIELTEAVSGKVIARIDRAVDVQPRDLWLWSGVPRVAGEQLEGRSTALSNALLASFVRPNHPEIAVLAREAADALGRATGDPAFCAYQLEDDADVAEKVEATVTAIYDTLRARRIAYSEPPPGWDYTKEGQRIRDHGDVARGGLGTCMDTTVLMAAVIEHVGLCPVLIFLPGHIFISYWRQDPRKRPDWPPGSPVVGVFVDSGKIIGDLDRVTALVDGRKLGVIETTALTIDSNKSAFQAREEARFERLAAVVQAVEQREDTAFIFLIDVAAARQEGVSPLPAVNARPDGVIEVHEYRPEGAAAVTEVKAEAADAASRRRQADTHPARYRTWKASLFSLDATNDLLNLPRNASVQPLVLPREGLGLLEDMLNRDVPINLYSGDDLPALWRARGNFQSAREMVEGGDRELRGEFMGQLNDRRVYVQRTARSGGQLTDVSGTFVKEMRSLARAAKTARDERGMNPLYLCLGLLRWPHKPGVFVDAPLILVPVNLSVARGGQEFSLALDSSGHTTPNAALIELLRREHDLIIPGLAEPLEDRAGIDVDGVLTEVRRAVTQSGLNLDVAAEARLALLDLSAFRMWQDLTANAERFLARPLIRHLVDTPTQTFVDPAAGDGHEASGDELEELETPMPADSTQKRAVLWARQGRTFVLQGPPGTGKSQTITNMVADCVMAGQRVLFVAEKGTALAVVERRLDAVGLGPFTLNLHHEGSNSTEVRAQLKSALTAVVIPDPVGMESARRRLRNARFELGQYPQQLHTRNAAGLSAYAAHDELLVLHDGPALPVTEAMVAHEADQLAALKDLFRDLQPWTSAAGVRQGHPWRLAGPGSGDPFDVDAVSAAVRAILAGLAWASTISGPLRDALDEITHPAQVDALAAAANPALPAGGGLVEVMDTVWPTRAPETVEGCERVVAGWRPRLQGFAPEVLGLDLRGVAAQLEAANESGFLGRRNRQNAAIAPLAAAAPSGVELTRDTAGQVLADLIAVQDAAAQVSASLLSVPGLDGTSPANPFAAGAFAPVWARLNQLAAATAGLRDGSEWTNHALALARNGHLTGQLDALTAYGTAWRHLWGQLVVQEDDFQAWRQGETLSATTKHSEAAWRRDVDFERLMSLQRWCALVRKLDPLRAAGLDQTRSGLLEGVLAASCAEDALARGIARASLSERISATGLDRFDAVAQDQRVTTYAQAQSEVRSQWVTDSPAQILARRGDAGTVWRPGRLGRRDRHASRSHARSWSLPNVHRQTRT